MLSSLRTALPAFLLWLAAAVCAAATPDAITPDGGRYYGPLVDGKLHGRGRIQWVNGNVYEGDVANGLLSGTGRLRFGDDNLYDGQWREGLMSGRGELRYQNGNAYRGEFVQGEFHGRGRFENANGDVYEGDFKRGEFTGTGRYARKDGPRYEGEFRNWQFQGRGRFTEPGGDVYEGDFSRGEFTGTGRYARKDGVRYEGEFRDWRYQGRGRFTDAGGDVWEGTFVDGRLEGPGRVSGRLGTYEGEFRSWVYHGQGRLKLPSGEVQEGAFVDGVYQGERKLRDAKRKQARDNVEVALYAQKELLDKALASLKPREPGRINLYLLAVAGDGSQEVFRREVEFVQGEFARRFGTSGRTVALVNSRSSVASAPMATVTSIRQALNAIAARMDREQDILFLFLTSHGSAEHELSLAQTGIDLQDLRAAELGTMLKESGIRWKVVVVSACYSGGFIDPLQDERSLIITAARRDRRSFGCADENDFTYFGRAFFKDSLPKSRSFVEAFRRAEALVGDWERKDMKDTKDSDENRSLPQISNAGAIDAQLKRWWSQTQR